MRIKRFYEQDENLEFTEQTKLSPDTISEILKKIQEISAIFNEKKEELENITNTISTFKSNSTTSNTQIDDSYLYLQEISKKLSDALDRLDEVHKNLTSYEESGEKFLVSNDKKK
jgi:ABC-type transporter Mla subunit MlaD